MGSDVAVVCVFLSSGNSAPFSGFWLNIFDLEGLAMMKKLALAVAVVGCLSASAFAADGRISQRSLAHMGLQGMTTMSDVQGMHVRGMSMRDSGLVNVNFYTNNQAFGGQGGAGGAGGAGGKGGDGGTATVGGGSQQPHYNTETPTSGGGTATANGGAGGAGGAGGSANGGGATAVTVNVPITIISSGSHHR
jgi:hypothetical protein